MAPDALIIASLRDPVERAFSHYKERRTNDTEPLSFAGGDRRRAAAPRGRGAPASWRTTGTSSFAHRHMSYVDQGRYAPMLERWFDAYGRDRVMVEISEEMYADPQAAVDRVTDRLALPRRTLRHPEPYNAEPDEGFDPDVRARLTELLAPDIAAVEDLLGRSLPWGARAAV